MTASSFLGAPPTETRGSAGDFASVSSAEDSALSSSAKRAAYGWVGAAEAPIRRSKAKALSIAENSLRFIVCTPFFRFDTLLSEL